MSDTQSWSRAVATKFRSTRSGAGRVWASRIAFRTRRRRLTPQIPNARINRATRFRLVRSPRSASSARICGAPQVPRLAAWAAAISTFRRSSARARALAPRSRHASYHSGRRPAGAPSPARSSRPGSLASVGTSRRGLPSEPGRRLAGPTLQGRGEKPDPVPDPGRNRGRYSTHGHPLACFRHWRPSARLSDGKERTVATSCGRGGGKAPHPGHGGRRKTILPGFALSQAGAGGMTGLSTLDDLASAMPGLLMAAQAR